MAWSKPKASAAERGYDKKHHKERVRRLSITRPSDPCAHCGRPLGPAWGMWPSGKRRALWHLPHNSDRTGYLPGMAHAFCNISDGGRVGRARQTTRRTTSLRW